MQTIWLSRCNKRGNDVLTQYSYRAFQLGIQRSLMIKVTNDILPTCRASMMVMHTWKSCAFRLDATGSIVALGLEKVMCQP